MYCFGDDLITKSGGLFIIVPQLPGDQRESPLQDGK